MSNLAELELVRKALMDGLGGCVEWDASVVDRVRRVLARYRLTLAAVQRDLIQYVRKGGDVVQIKEEREPWKDRRDYWYKVIVPMPHVFQKGLFVELVLVDADPDVPEIELVNAHEQI